MSVNKLFRNADKFIEDLSEEQLRQYLTILIVEKCLVDYKYERDQDYQDLQCSVKEEAGNWQYEELDEVIMATRFHELGDVYYLNDK